MQMVIKTASRVAGDGQAPPGAVILRSMTWDEELDATGMLCPLPVLKARKRLRGMAPGAVLRLLATDPAAVVDVPHFCAEAGHDLLGVEDLPDRADGAQV
jgi:tRNA 2-thiouridine synthesizing protein A